MDIKHKMMIYIIPFAKIDHLIRNGAIVRERSLEARKPASAHGKGRLGNFFPKGKNT